MNESLASAEISIATSILAVVLAVQGPAWGNEVTPAQKDSDWVRVEDLEPPSESEEPLQDWGVATESGPPNPHDANQIPSSWKFKTRSIEENAPDTTVDPQTTFTF